MTFYDIRGYIPIAAAKSVVGISLLDITTAHSRVSGFFMRKAHPYLNYGGLAGALRRAGFCSDR
ncbi:hypothetical protein EH206_09765 [Brenneria nigrifluens DSM 30175 = ATCC 13028]|uniref:Uncharacterized protein n=1 Tax=Brenneria nigrifluens DSM 30175 = ATCC 13028 TaxID=1121120 RepID=A0A2U1UII7_9GAMM|nr:hypothetical protein DDT54_18745 [Brenneria nigrifluens DSM 30175 = ATCC 13028]QCR04434.1 hypothetical protein EH206_09765 [Brenneria nigrifluens DSM 30175 = ATCC 13028]